MKRIKEILDFLKSLLDFLMSLKVWLPTLIAVVLSAIGYLSGIADKNIKIEMPLLVIVGIITLSLYPILKFLEYVLTPRKPFSYGGLLWKPSRTHLKNSF